MVTPKDVDSLRKAKMAFLTPRVSKSNVSNAPTAGVQFVGPFDERLGMNELAKDASLYDQTAGKDNDSLYALAAFPAASAITAGARGLSVISSAVVGSLRNRKSSKGGSKPDGFKSGAAKEVGKQVAGRGITAALGYTGLRAAVSQVLERADSLEDAISGIAGANDALLDLLTQTLESAEGKDISSILEDILQAIEGGGYEEEVSTQLGIIIGPDHNPVITNRKRRRKPNANPVVTGDELVRQSDRIGIHPEGQTEGVDLPSWPGDQLPNLRNAVR